MNRLTIGWSRRRGRSKVSLALVAATLALTGCGSPTSVGQAAQENDDATKVYAKADSLSGQERVDYLVERAKAEGGKLRLYTSYSETTLPKVISAFEKAYGIEVSAYRGTPEDIATRVTAEAKADYAKPADVVEARSYEMYQLSREHLIRSLANAVDSSFPRSAQFSDWTADRVVLITPCWNTTKVARSEVPTSYEDLAEPRWKGRLSIELLDDNWFQTLFQYLVGQGRSKSEVETFFRKVAANASVAKGHTAMQELISAGQADLGVDCYTYVTEQQKAAGAPVEWKPGVAPVISQPNGVGLTANARHPAAAALYYQWILGDGQKVLAETGNTLPTVHTAVRTIPLDTEGYAREVQEWRDLYDDILDGHG